MKIRTSGLLLPIQCLPGRFGIGDLGPAAREFVDFLNAAGQHVWQILPVNPTLSGRSHSPYFSPSAFAFNPLLISPEQMVSDGLITKKDLVNIEKPASPADRIDYNGAAAVKKRLFVKAFKGYRRDRGFHDFCVRNAFWIDDYALFTVLSLQDKGRSWRYWPSGLRSRDPAELKSAADRFADQTAYIRFLQYVFSIQWEHLKSFCRSRGVQLMGDMPIYVPYHSADTWCRPELFKLDAQKRPSAVSGVPPDYFSSTGQRWGHPVYQWEAHQETGFEWWMQRIRHNLALFDYLRIDHFRGLVAYWEIPAGEKTAVNGQWRKVPTADFFRTLLRNIPCPPLIAEDLGVITADVRETMRRYHLPGMRVLVFGFGGDPSENPNAPHHVGLDCAVYTGTHDTNTARGWFEQEASGAGRELAARYFGKPLTGPEFARELIRAAMVSPAWLSVIPVQDLLELGAEARINNPGRPRGNWLWRLQPDAVNAGVGRWLHGLTRLYGRL